MLIGIFSVNLWELVGTSQVPWEHCGNFVRTSWELEGSHGNLWKLMGTCGILKKLMGPLWNFVGSSWKLEGSHENVAEIWRVLWELVGTSWVPWELVGTYGNL